MGGRIRYRDAVTLDEIERLAKSPEIDQLLHPVSLGLPTCRNCARPRRARRGCATAIPGTCLPGEVEYGDLAWASLDGQPVAVGRFRAGSLHPERVFNL
jgi:tRNA pseudouridine55 synthase